MSNDNDSENEEYDGWEYILKYKSWICKNSAYVDKFLNTNINFYNISIIIVINCYTTINCFALLFVTN